MQPCHGAARNMPRSFPLDQVESSVDYDYVAIGEGKYLLPVHSIRGSQGTFLDERIATQSWLYVSRRKSIQEVSGQTSAESGRSAGAREDEAVAVRRGCA
jgi:hypothetical protein